MTTAMITPTRPPEQSLDQRMAALQRANEVRTRKAVLKRDIKAGHRDLAQVLIDPPDYLLSAKIWELLLCVPKWGRVKVNHLLRCEAISWSKTVGGLSPRQRDAIVRRLERSRGA